MAIGRRTPRYQSWRRSVATGFAVAVLLLVGVGALAQEQEAGTGTPQDRDALHGFLQAVAAHPGVQAAQAALQAARHQLDAAFDPIQFDLTGAYTSLDVDSDFLELIDYVSQSPGVDPTLPTGFVTDGAIINASLTFRPFPFGDIADLADQRQFALQLARLDYLESLTGLEAQALSLALSQALAAQGVELAGQALELSEEALEVAYTRFERGAATERDVREAQAGLIEAQAALANAQANLQLSRSSLHSLVGDTAVPELDGLALPVPVGTPLSVQRSRIQALQAQLGPRGARRNMQPVVQAGYSLNVSEEATVDFSIESRTLQPSVSYNFQPQLGPVYPSQEPQLPDYPGFADVDIPENPVQGSFQIGVSVSLSAGAQSELRAAELQAQAAQSAYEAALQGAQLEFDSLVASLEESIRAEQVARVRLHNATLALEEAQAQLDAGLGVPLEVQSTALELTQAHLNFSQARQQVVQNTLAFYEFYGIPLSEALR